MGKLKIFTQGIILFAFELKINKWRWIMYPVKRRRQILLQNFKPG